MATSLLTMKDLLFQYLGAQRPLVATAGSTSAFTQADLADNEDDSLIGWQVRVIDGAAAGDLRVLSAGPSSAGVLTPVRNFSGAVGAADTGYLWGNAISGGAELTALFNRALRVAKPLTETKLTIATGRRVYDVTGLVSDPEDVLRVWRHALDSTYAMPYSRTSLGRPVVGRHLTPVQTITISGSPTSGTYTTTCHGTTRNWSISTISSSLQIALRADTGCSTLTVTATGTVPNYTHTITYTGFTGSSDLAVAIGTMTGGTAAIALADAAGIPAIWLTLPTSYTAQTTETEELWVQHYKRLADFTSDTSTVDDAYAEWLVWETLLLLAVQEATTNKADRSNWADMAKVARSNCLGLRDTFAPYQPQFISPMVAP